MGKIPLRKFGLRNSATIILVSNIKQKDIRPAFKFDLHPGIHMWEDLLMSRLILRRRHIYFSNLTFIRRTHTILLSRYLTNPLNGCAAAI